MKETQEYINNGLKEGLSEYELQQWKAELICEDEGFQEISVEPINDIMPHTRSESCNCKPRVEYYYGVKNIIHNAFDFREELEECNMEIKN